MPLAKNYRRIDAYQATRLAILLLQIQFRQFKLSQYLTCAFSQQFSGFGRADCTRIPVQQLGL